jgi:hypothetical protein
MSPTNTILTYARSTLADARLVSCRYDERDLALENLALRHQIGALKRIIGTRRVYLKPTDRKLWVVLSCVWSGWQQALAIVQAATVIQPVPVLVGSYLAPMVAQASDRMIDWRAPSIMDLIAVNRRMCGDRCPLFSTLVFAGVSVVLQQPQYF